MEVVEVKMQPSPSQNLKPSVQTGMHADESQVRAVEFVFRIGPRRACFILAEPSVTQLLREELREIAREEGESTDAFGLSKQANLMAAIRALRCLMRRRQLVSRRFESNMIGHLLAAAAG